MLAAGLTAAAALISTVLPHACLLVWNVTASVPTGLYWIEAGSALRVGDRVAIEPPRKWQEYLARRDYLPEGVPFLKEVAALPGDTVCRSGPALSINGKIAGTARAADSAGRDLPAWQGCVTLTSGELFVMNRQVPDSFDGRYFGPVGRTRVVGRAVPVWTDEDGHGEHVWFAPLSSSQPPIEHKGDDQ